MRNHALAVRSRMRAAWPLHPSPRGNFSLLVWFSPLSPPLCFTHVRAGLLSAPALAPESVGSPRAFPASPSFFLTGKDRPPTRRRRGIRLSAQPRGRPEGAEVSHDLAARSEATVESAAAAVAGEREVHAANCAGGHDLLVALDGECYGPGSLVEVRQQLAASAEARIEDAVRSAAGERELSRIFSA